MIVIFIAMNAFGLLRVETAFLCASLSIRQLSNLINFFKTSLEIITEIS